MKVMKKPAWFHPPLPFYLRSHMVSKKTGQITMDNLLFREEDDKEEDDATLVDLMSVTKDTSNITSEEFTEAQSAIISDKWDTYNWLVYIEEAENSRSGSISVSDAYKKFLHQFPRSGKFWKSLADYYIRVDDLISAEQIFHKSLLKCRCISLWQSYITFVKKKQIQSRNEESDEIYREYIDFIKEWPESKDLENEQKLFTLRSIYHRAISVPTESLDIFWKEYEQLERTASIALAEKLLPEYNEKYLQAKVTFKDRYKFTSRINFDRISVPSNKSLQEIQQLDSWNQWIKFEMSNPENLTPDIHRNMMLMLFDQCLCCFLFHPEVWISLAKFTTGYTEISAVYKSAIEIIPNSVYLRIALSEHEEINNKLNDAKETLKVAFEKMPSAVTFSVYQKFVRRHESIDAARKLFSDTLPLRKEKILNADVYLVHARLEMEVNCCIDVALKTLQLARLAHPECIKEYSYVHLMTQILVRLGDLAQIQSIFHVALGEDAYSVGNVVTNNIGQPPPSTVGGTTNNSTSLISCGIAESKSLVSNVRSTPLNILYDNYLLWEDYLYAETTLGVSNLSRIIHIRSKRDKAKQLYEEKKFSLKAATAKTYTTGLYDSVNELYERYTYSLGVPCPSLDDDLRIRSNNKVLLNELIKQENDRILALKDAGTKKSTKRGREEITDEILANISGVPAIIRDLLPKLPSVQGQPLPDIQGFIKHLRSLVLPPRPSVNQEFDFDRDKQSWNMDDNDGDDDETDIFNTSRNDIFKIRQRARLNMV